MDVLYIALGAGGRRSKSCHPDQGSAGSRLLGPEPVVVDRSDVVIDRFLRRPAALALVVGVLILPGCGLPGPAGDPLPHDAASGGQTFAEAQSALESLDGISLSSFSCSDGPNIKGNTGCVVDLELEPGHEIVDGPGLVAHVARTVWSVRDTWMPNTDISVSMRAGAESDFDVTTAAYLDGWTPRRASVQSGASETNPTNWSRVSIWVRPDREDTAEDTRNLRRLGQWPGDVPAVPAPFTERRDG